MVSNFEKSDALDFHIVDERAAKEGLEKGDYYMVVTLPKDLSAKAASILTNHPEQMTIAYQTSSGHSFIAGKMSDSAMIKIQHRSLISGFLPLLFPSLSSSFPSFRKERWYRFG